LAVVIVLARFPEARLPTAAIALAADAFTSFLALPATPPAAVVAAFLPLAIRQANVRLISTVIGHHVPRTSGIKHRVLRLLLLRCSLSVRRIE